MGAQASEQLWIIFTLELSLMCDESNDKSQNESMACTVDLEE